MRRCTRCLMILYNVSVLQSNTEEYYIWSYTTHWSTPLKAVLQCIEGNAAVAKQLGLWTMSSSIHILWFFRIITDSNVCSHGINGRDTIKDFKTSWQEAPGEFMPTSARGVGRSCFRLSCSFYKKREDKKALKSSNGFIAQQRRYLCHIALTKLCITVFSMSSNWTISITGGSSTPLSIISGIRFRHIPYARYVIWNICRSR